MSTQVFVGRTEDIYSSYLHPAWYSCITARSGLTYDDADEIKQAMSTPHCPSRTIHLDLVRCREILFVGENFLLSFSQPRNI